MNTLDRWHVATPARLHLRHWADEAEWLVFNEASGDLHLLNAEAAAVLNRLAGGPASIDDLCGASDDLDPTAVRRLMDQLDGLGLVSPVLP